MSAPAFTPGPWQAMNPYQWDCIIGDIDGPDNGDMHYKIVTDLTVDGPSARADARLIAAAPSLYYALLRALPHVEHAYHTNPDADGSMWADVVACRDALTKAVQS